MHSRYTKLQLAPSLFLELVSQPFLECCSSSSTSRPESAKCLATARPTTPALRMSLACLNSLEKVRSWKHRSDSIQMKSKSLPAPTITHSQSIAPLPIEKERLQYPEMALAAPIKIVMDFVACRICAEYAKLIPTHYCSIQICVKLSRTTHRTHAYQQ